MILYRSKLVRHAVCYFDEDCVNSAVDVVTYFQASRRYHPTNWEAFSSLVTDLRHDERELNRRLDKGCAYEIRRAQGKDEVFGVLVDVLQDIELDRFVKFYNEFAELVGVSEVDIVALRRLRDAGLLAVTRAETAKLGVLAYHVYIAHGAQRRTRLLYSASQFRRKDADQSLRSLYGRANRFLHWHDLLLFKRLDFLCYDWGGWYSGDANLALMRINQFKESFGGTYERRYHSVQARTLLGHVWLGLKELRLMLCTPKLFRDRLSRQRASEDITLAGDRRA